MTLTDLFSVLYFTTPVGCGIQEGWVAGVSGILIGLGVGLALGIAGFCGVRAVMKRAALPPEVGKTNSARLLMYRLLVMVLFWGIFASGYLAMLVTKSVIHYYYVAA